jgi:hypothetical protein
MERRYFFAWLWTEVLLCLGAAFVTALFGLAMSAHWIFIGARWGEWVPVESYALTAYSIGIGLGTAAIVILMRTKFGFLATRRSLQFVRVGLLLAIVAVLLFPAGTATNSRLGDMFSISREIVGAALPCIAFVHFAYLGRKFVF